MAVPLGRAGLSRVTQAALQLQASARLSATAVQSRAGHVNALVDPTPIPWPAKPPNVSEMVQGTGLEQNFTGGMDDVAHLEASGTPARDLSPLRARSGKHDPASLAPEAHVRPSPPLTGSAGALRLEQSSEGSWGPWATWESEQKQQQRGMSEAEREAGVKHKLSLTSPIEDVF